MESKDLINQEKNLALSLEQASIKDIPYILNQVNEKIKSLQPASDNTNEMLNTNLEGFGKISTINDISILIKAYSMIKGKENIYKESAEELGINVSEYPFKMEGISGKIWKSVIKFRISQTFNKKEIADLKKIKKTLEANLTAEARFANDWEVIKGILTK